MGDLPPFVQSFVGPSVLGFLALFLWLLKSGYLAKKTWRTDRRAERKEDATDEYEMAVQNDKVLSLQTERELKINEVWKSQFKEERQRNKEQIDELEGRRAADYAEYTHRLLGYQGELSDANARIALLETENVKCTQTTTAQAIRIGGLEDRVVLILQAAKAAGFDLGLDWMLPKPLPPQSPTQPPPQPPAPTPPTITTMIVQSETGTASGEAAK